MLVTELHFLAVCLIKLLDPFGNMKHLANVYFVAAYYNNFLIPKRGKVMYFNK